MLAIHSHTLWDHLNEKSLGWWPSGWNDVMLLTVIRTWSQESQMKTLLPAHAAMDVMVGMSDNFCESPSRNSPWLSMWAKGLESQGWLDSNLYRNPTRGVGSWTRIQATYKSISPSPHVWPAFTCSHPSLSETTGMSLGSEEMRDGRGRSTSCSNIHYSLLFGKGICYFFFFSWGIIWK